MGDKLWKVRWHGVNCSGYFNRTFEDKEDAEMFGQNWLLDCILGEIDFGDSYTYEVTSYLKMPIWDPFLKMPIWDPFWD